MISLSEFVLTANREYDTAWMKHRLEEKQARPITAPEVQPYVFRPGCFPQQRRTEAWRAPNLQPGGRAGN